MKGNRMIDPPFNGPRAKRLLRLSLLGIAAPLFLSAPVLGDLSGTGCAPRSHLEPGRLNIALDAKDYGLVPPCEPSLNLYIARNSSLRAVEGVLRLTPDGNTPSAQDVFLDLTRTDHGMFAAEISPDPATGKPCRGVSVDLEIENCLGKDGGVIACPEIRVKAPEVFAGLEVSGEHLHVCHDD